MPRHYLKISKRLRPYAAKVALLDEDWRTTIFHDLTHGGRELRIVPVAPNEQGPLIGLCGERFFCHAGQDKHNAYSLFISRITPSNYRPGSDSPARIAGEFELITESDWDPPPRDPVKPLFEKARSMNGGQIMVGPPAYTYAEDDEDDAGAGSADAAGFEPYSDLDDSGAPSEDLLRVLEAGGTALRVAWSQAPTPLGSAAGGGAGLLAALKELFHRFHIEDYVELEPRPLALLKGTITPSQISEADCRDIAQAFSVGTLNAMVCSADTGEGAATASVPEAEPPVLELTRALASLPLDPEVYLPIADAVVHATSRSLVQGERRRAVEQWVTGQCGITRASVLRQRAKLREALERWLERDRQADADDLLGLIRRVERLRHHVNACRDALPELERVEQRKREAERAFIKAMGTLGDATAELLEHDPELSADALLDIAELVKQRSKLVALPTWLWGESVTYEALAASSSRMVRLQQLTDSGQRARVKRACELMDRIDPGVYELLSRFPGPPADVSPESYFVHAIDKLARAPRELFGLVDPHLGWVPLALDEGWPGERIPPVLKAVDALMERLDPDTAAPLLRDLADVIMSARVPEAAESRVLEYTAAIEQIESLFGTARDATWSQIERLLERRERDKGSAAAPAGKTTPSGPLLRIDHNWVDETGRRVPLVLVPHDDRERPYGVIRVPLVVRTPTPREVSCELEVEIASSLHQNWPESWERYSPRSLRIPASAWREAGDEVQYTFTLEVPLKPPKTGKESVDIGLRALDSKSGWPICERKRLRWSRISVWQGEIPFAWPDTVHPEFVRQHPIGPQRRFEDIMQRLSTGGSFAVIAPRRFGKTTLVEYLHETAAARRLAMPPPVVCTSFMGEHGMDYAALFAEVSAGFEALLGVGLRRSAAEASAHDPLSAALPAADAFEDVRAAARERGMSAVVVLFDEAQLMFPRHGGDRLGNAIKDRLERSWSRGDSPPVALGFIGLPGLRERAGANLMGILRPYEGRHVEERSLNRLILHATKERLSTTREARQRLAQQAGNLYMLKTLLDRLVRHANRERRNWAAYQDVRDVEAELRAELERGEAGNLTQYMRDPLNRSEDINHWDPRAAYPVALAVAAAAAENPDASARENIEAAAERMDRWCLELGRETKHRLTFPKKRMDEHMTSLRDLGLWDGERFVSQLVQSWLVGMARGFPADDSDRRALMRAALPRIRVPAEREPVRVEPGAQVYRVTRDATEYSLIQIPLFDESSRQRFVARVDALQLIMERQQRGEPGSEYLCPIVDAGLAEGANLGVAIHRWVEGAALDTEVGHLDAPLLIELGSKLASALCLLHDHDVVHEHINPAHVVLERSTARPVLVDFGISRIGHAAARSAARVGGRALPRATLGEPGALLGQEADVRALVATLMELWDREHATEEERAALAPLAGETDSAGQKNGRLDAHELLRRLDRAGESLHAYRVLEDAWQELRALAAKELDQRWFREVMDRFRGTLTAMRFGLYADPLVRDCELAVFLSRIAERRPRSGDTPEPEDVALRTIRALGERLMRATPSMEREHLARELDIPDATASSALVTQAARSLARSADLACLPGLIQLLSSRAHAAR